MTYMFLRFIIILTIVFHALPATAASIIRDAEIEQVLKELTEPILVAAGLSPQSVKLYIVQDDQINAYVMGGQNIFINTGLMRLSTDPNMLIGVIAHEAGHIAGGHLVRIQNEFQDVSLQSTFGFLLGIAASVAGSPEAGQAIIAGTAHVAERSLLKFTRTQEEAADQAALTYLNSIGYSPKGLLELLNTLYNQENILYDSVNPYTRSHPLSRERMTHIQHYLKQHPPKNNIPEKLKQQFKLAIIKLRAFTEDKERILKAYPESDTSQEALYARAIALYRIPDHKSALEQINKLIALYPHNPFYVELKGQMMFEHGNIKEAITYYQKSQELLGHSPLINIGLATAYLATEENNNAKPAISLLEQALTVEPKNSFIWHQLAVAYGRDGQLGLSNLASAEKALLAGKVNDAKDFVKRAEEYIKPGSRAELKKQDILVAIDLAKNKKTQRR